VTVTDAPPEASGTRRRALVAAALAAGVALLVLPVAFSDGRRLLETIRSVRATELAASAILTLLSYLAMSRSYQGIACAAGVDLPFRAWARITLVSNTANYLVTTAGLSGFAVRMYLLAQRGVRPGRAVLISLVQTFLTNLTLLAFILLGFATLVARHYLPEGTLIGASVVLATLSATLLYAAVLVLHRDLRRRTLFVVADRMHRVLRRLSPRWTPGRLKLWRFQHNLNEGFDFLLSRKDRIIAPTAWITLDWVLTLAILWAAFRAVGHPVPVGIVIVGFAVGICVSLASLVPGGLGIMESSMTAVFVSLGVPLEPSVVAVLIFRLVYYVLPLCVSLFVFHGLMGQVARAAGAAAWSGAQGFDSSAPRR
jgi:uncharacterized protein (TIRG00374 family)